MKIILLENLRKIMLNQKEYIQLKQWTLWGSTLLKEEEWREVLKHVKFTGGYDFVNAKKLNLVTKR